MDESCMNCKYGKVVQYFNYKPYIMECGMQVDCEGNPLEVEPDDVCELFEFIECKEMSDED